MPRRPLPTFLAVLACANVAANRFPVLSPAVGVALTGAAAQIARGSRLSPAEVGLDRSAVRSGMRWGTTSALVVGAGYGLAFLVPAARAAASASSRPSWRHTLTAVFVEIPLATVIPEEFAFRAVLPGLLGRTWGRRIVTVTTSALFGLWHVLPALAQSPANQAVDSVTGGRSRMPAAVIGNVLMTSAAGLVLSELRVRSGSVLAPILAHWSINGFGALFLRLARDRRPGNSRSDPRGRQSGSQ